MISFHYVDDLCISFGAVEHYDYKLIAAVCQHLEQTINNIILTFFVSICHFIVFESQRIVYDIELSKLVSKQPIYRTR